MTRAVTAVPSIAEVEILLATLIMKGSSVVEVGFTRWQSEDGSAWTLVEGSPIFALERLEGETA